MTDRDEKDAKFHLFSWLWENLDTLAIIGTVGAALWKGSIPEDADPKAKAAAKAMGASVGGKGDPADEAFFKEVRASLGTNVDRKRLQAILTQFTIYAFQINHEERWVRERGRDAFEEWRVIICKMGSPNKRIAIDYATELTRDILKVYVKECKRKHVKPWPFDEKKATHINAQKVAFDAAIEQMQSEGTYVPTGTEAALLIQLKNLATLMGPKVFDAGKAAYDKAKSVYDIAYKHIQDHSPEYVEKAKETTKAGWDHATEVATKTDRKVAVYARHRKIKDAGRPWYIRVVDKLL